MRRSLAWALGATAALTVAALAFDDQPTRAVVAAVHRATPDIAFARVTPHEETPPPLPAHLEPLAVESARRDIFVPLEAPAPPVKASPRAEPLPQPAPAPVPAAPPMTWRYLGAMTKPDGERLVMLARGDSSAAIQVGTRLEEGYVVEAIGTDKVRLVYPPLGTVVDVPIPAVSGAAR